MTLNLPLAILRWTALLRATQLRQAHGAFEKSWSIDPKTGKVDNNTPSYCALGMFCIANDAPARTPEPDDPNRLSDNYDFVKQYFTKEGYEDIYIKNDNMRLSFPELADWAETYFAAHPKLLITSTSDAGHAG